MTTIQSERPIERDGMPNDEEEDRQLDELISELRVVLPGVTVLFAFLLTLPFTGDFDQLGTVDRGAYFLAFLASAASIVALVGESAYHRLVGKPYDKGLLIRTAGRQAVAGIASLAVALSAVVFLVTNVVYDDTLAAVLTASVLVAAVSVWFVLPLSRRVRPEH